MTFEQFLMDMWQNEIIGTEDDVLDDHIPDAFDKWLGAVSVETIIKYGEEFGKFRETAMLDRIEKPLKECVNHDWECSCVSKALAIIESINIGEE